jgi:hypothetical protein
MENKILNNNSILVYSSLIFITNIFTAFYKKYYFYSFLFLALTITSVIHHSTNNVYSDVMDKIFILSIVLYGSYVLYNKMDKNKYVEISLIIISFLLCIFLYFYGYFTKKYCFDSNNYIANNYHCLLHFISSIGHHLIVFL